MSESTVLSRDPFRGRDPRMKLTALFSILAECNIGYIGGAFQLATPRPHLSKSLRYLGIEFCALQRG